MSEVLLSVEDASLRLGLHAKTVLRFIRDGKLRATKVGKQYRILQSDLDTLVGAPPPRLVPSRARTTCVVDIEDVDSSLRQRLTAVLIGARRDTVGPAAALSVDIAHDPLRRSVKVIAIGTPRDVAVLLDLVDACLEQ